MGIIGSISMHPNYSIALLQIAVLERSKKTHERINYI